MRYLAASSLSQHKPMSRQYLTKFPSVKSAKPQRSTTVATLVICGLCSSLVCCFLLFVEGSRAGLCWADCRAPRGILCAPWQDGMWRALGLGCLEFSEALKGRFLWTQVLSGSKVGSNNQVHIADRKLKGVWRSENKLQRCSRKF